MNHPIHKSKFEIWAKLNSQKHIQSYLYGFNPENMEIINFKKADSGPIRASFKDFEDKKARMVHCNKKYHCILIFPLTWVNSVDLSLLKFNPTYAMDTLIAQKYLTEIAQVWL